jgi:hypothetical protein
MSNLQELANILEPMIRRIIREELVDFAQKNQDIFYLNPNSELYKDLEDIAQRKVSQQIKLSSHQEVWDE